MLGLQPGYLRLHHLCGDDLDTRPGRGVVADRLRAALQQRPDAVDRGQHRPVISEFLVDRDRGAFAVEDDLAAAIALPAGLAADDAAARMRDSSGEIVFDGEGDRKTTPLNSTHQ